MLENQGMKEREEKAYAFWKRVDGLRQGTLRELAEVIQMKEQSLRVMRSRCSIPNALAVKALAEHLGTTTSYLLTGVVEERKKPIEEGRKDIPEVEYVRSNPEAQTLIRAVMRNPRLLEALAVVIESEEEYRKAQ